MHTDDLVGSLGGGGDGRDGNRRGVGCENRFRLANPVKFGENFLLEGENFWHGLHHEVAISTHSTVCPGRDSGEGSVGVVLRHTLFADKFAKRELNGAQTLLDVLVFDVNHDHIIARTGSHLCDTVAHLSCADYANALNHRFTFVQIHSHTVHEDVDSFGRRRGKEYPL